MAVGLSPMVRARRRAGIHACGSALHVAAAASAAEPAQRDGWTNWQ